MLLRHQANNTRKKSLILIITLMALIVTVTVLLGDRIANKTNVIIAIVLGVIATSFLYAYDFLVSLTPENKRVYLIIALNTISSIGYAFALSTFYCSFFSDKPLGAASILRVALLFPFTILISCFAVYEPSRVLQFLHDKRWFIAAGLFLFMVALNLNFSNAASFHYYIQPNIKTDFTLPIFGVHRDIRSDEWLVDTPRRASAAYNNYGLYNYICRGTENFGISASYLYLSFSMLSNPFNLGYYILGTEYGAAFHWCGLFISSIIISYEFSLIISKGNKRVALLGAAILGLSSFSLWWSINIHIIAVLSLLVCAYYYFRTENFKKQILLALGVALSASTFICQLYPAWQVPLAYILLALFSWVIIDNFDKVRSLKGKQWATIAAAFALMCSVVISYLYDSREYSKAVVDTVYPGSRFDNGGNAFYKGSWYIQTLLYPFKNTGNNSEAGIFFNLFPLPMILATLLFLFQIYRKIRNKSEKIDSFLGLLLLPTVLLTVYCTVGIPNWLAKITLLSYSIESRAIDFLSFANTLFLLRLISRKDEDRHFIPISAGLSVSILLILYNIKTATTNYPQYMGYIYVAIITLIVVGFSLLLLSRVPTKLKNSILTITIASVAISGLSILPINRGLDAIYEKPASVQVQSIRNAEPNAKWIGYDSIVTPQFLIANGAPTINSVNYIPNMELWQKLDENGAYNEIYNRYAHVYVVFCEEETWFQLVQADCMVLHISYKDIIKTDVKYIYSHYPIAENSDYIDLELLYNEDNSFIYKLLYN